MNGFGLVFSGGGGKGAYEIGVWKYLQLRVFLCTKKASFQIKPAETNSDSQRLSAEKQRDAHLPSYSDDAVSFHDNSPFMNTLRGQRYSAFTNHGWDTW